MWLVKSNADSLRDLTYTECPDVLKREGASDGPKWAALSLSSSGLVRAISAEPRLVNLQLSIEAITPPVLQDLLSAIPCLEKLGVTLPAIGPQGLATAPASLTVLGLGLHTLDPDDDEEAVFHTLNHLKVCPLGSVCYLVVFMKDAWGTSGDKVVKRIKAIGRARKLKVVVS